MQVLSNWQRFRDEQLILLNWLSNKEETLKDMGRTDLTDEAEVKDHLEKLRVSVIPELTFASTFDQLGGRGDDLAVSALGSRSRGPDSSPGRFILLLSWAKHFTLKVQLSTQEYKLGTGELVGKPAEMLGVICNELHVASHPGGVAILLVTSCYRNRVNSGSNGPLGS